MKKNIVAFLIMFSVVGVIKAQDKVVLTEDIKDQVVKWEPTFKQAVIKAKKEKKPILIYFTGSDWCGPCITLDNELFHTSKFENLASENMILYMANFPRNTDLVTKANKKTNEELSKRYHQSSFPTIIMINAKGKELGRKNGSYMAEYYYPFFEEVLQQYKTKKIR